MPLFLYIIWEFITSPFGQMVLWGSLTVASFIATLPLLGNARHNGDLRVAAISLITLFWVFNISMWFTATVNWMLFTDTMFFGLAAYFYWKVRTTWSIVLAGLYFTSFVLDILFWRGMSQQTYAWLANGAYLCQLITVSGPGWRLIFVRHADKNA